MLYELGYVSSHSADNYSCVEMMPRPNAKLKLGNTFCVRGGSYPSAQARGPFTILAVTVDPNPQKMGATVTVLVKYTSSEAVLHASTLLHHLQIIILILPLPFLLLFLLYVF